MPVSAPFHCDLMDNAKLVMQNDLMNIVLINRLFQLFKILLLMLQRDIKTIKINLVNQITATVRWRETMEKFMELGLSH